MSSSRDPRFSVNHEFSSIEQFISDYVSNISRSGVFVRSKDPLPPGTRVNLRFSILAEQVEIIEGVGEVTRLSKDPPGMGVAFIELSDYSEKLLAKLLTK